MASRRASRRVMDYTTQWANDLLARSASTPTSSGLGNPMLAADCDASLANYSLTERRRWTRWVCVITLLSLVANIASTVFVVIWLRSSARPAEDSIVRQFLQQDISGQVLRHARYLSLPSTYTKLGDQSIHDEDIRVAMHMLLPAVADANRHHLSDDGKMQAVVGWEPNSPVHFSDKSGVILDKPTGTLKIGRDGYYQIYSQLSFKPHLNQTADVPREYEQQLKDVAKEQILLQDNEKANCSGSYRDIHIPCHTSSMFSVLRLQKGSRLQLWARPINGIARGDKFTFFGVFRLD